MEMKKLSHTLLYDRHTTYQQLAGMYTPLSVNEYGDVWLIADIVVMTVVGSGCL